MAENQEVARLVWMIDALIKTLHENMRRLDDDIEQIRRDDREEHDRIVDALVRIRESLPQQCQANELGAAIRQVTWERKQDQLQHAVDEVTGQHKLSDLKTETFQITSSGASIRWGVLKDVWKYGKYVLLPLSGGGLYHAILEIARHVK